MDFASILVTEHLSKSFSQLFLFFFRINYWFLANRARNGARNPSRSRKGPNQQQQQQRGANRQRGKQQQVRGRSQKKIGLYLLFTTLLLFAEAKR